MLVSKKTMGDSTFAKSLAKAELRCFATVSRQNPRRASGIRRSLQEQIGFVEHVLSTYCGHPGSSLSDWDQGSGFHSTI